MTDIIAENTYDSKKPILDKDDKLIKYYYYHLIPILKDGKKLFKIMANDEEVNMMYGDVIRDNDNWEEHHKYTVVMDEEITLKIFYH